MKKYTVAAIIHGFEGYLRTKITANCQDEAIESFQEIVTQLDGGDLDITVVDSSKNIAE